MAILKVFIVMVGRSIEAIQFLAHLISVILKASTKVGLLVLITTILLVLVN
jgi:hypothetical protein